jgi:hypothetical protein
MLCIICLPCRIQASSIINFYLVSNTTGCIEGNIVASVTHKLTYLLFTIGRSVNGFLLFFLCLLLVEVAVSLAFKYAVEIDDKYSKLSHFK